MNIVNFHLSFYPFQLAKNEIWRSRSLEIDPATGCLFSIILEGGLPYRKSEKDNRYIYRFVRYNVPSDNDELSNRNFLNANSSPQKYLDCNLRIGDHVVITFKIINYGRTYV